MTERRKEGTIPHGTEKKFHSNEMKEDTVMLLHDTKLPIERREDPFEHCSSTGVKLNESYRTTRWIDPTDD